ncbi:MAG: carbon-nitrogen hydrolase family protein [Clostridiales bacterium]|nr:carbon-nitrogen hydrolase family protein [Clostridiales bacterium]
MQKRLKGVFRLALCQMNVIDDKAANVKQALYMLDRAAEGKADIVVLPEMFNCPYDKRKFKEYSEAVPNGFTTSSLSAKARELGIYIIGGSIPELDDGRIYNTSVIFGPDGRVLGKHRKIHLFDIDVPGKIKVTESEVLSPGEEPTIIDTEFCRLGVAICYDMRFPELIRKMTLNGAELVVIPGAFNMVTGPAHWELLIRTRAMDNQVFFAAASPARDYESSYVAYGNSMVSSPWAEILARAGEGEEIIFADIDLSEEDRIRRELPLLMHRRPELY